MTKRAIGVVLGGLGVAGAVALISMMATGQRPESGPDKSAGTTGDRARVRSPGEGHDPQLLVRASGSLYLAYAVHAANGQGSDLVMVTSGDDGDTFSPPLRINDQPGEINAHGENSAQFRLGKRSEFYAVWDGQGDIRFARSVNYGRSFTPAIAVNDDVEKAGQSFPAMEVAGDGTVYAAWLDSRKVPGGSPGTSSVFVTRSTDRGATFEKNAFVSAGVCPCCRPAIATGHDGLVFVAWRHVFEGNVRDLAIAVSGNGGVDWSSPTRVAADGWVIDGCPHSGPSMVFREGVLTISWYTDSGDRSLLKLARSRDKGRSFEPAVEFQGDVLDANHPCLAVIGNDIWGIFQGRDATVDEGWGATQPWLVRLLPDGEVSRPQPLDVPDGNVSYPRVASGTGGRVYVALNSAEEAGTRVGLWRGRVGELNPAP